jgi:hypothetical protein
MSSFGMSAEGCKRNDMSVKCEVKLSSQQQLHDNHDI